MELYWRLPVLAQEGVLSLYARRLNWLYYGGAFESEFRQIRDTRWPSREAIEAWQITRVRDIVESSRRHVPHYKEVLVGVEPAALRSVGDLQRLPMLDRQAVRQHEREFLDERVEPTRLFKDKTSGSTGTAVSVYWPLKPLRRFHAAVEVRMRNAAGVTRWTPRAMLGGRPIVRGDRVRPPFWRYNRFWKQLYLSSYHVSRTTAPLYIAAIRKAGVEWITGYGSALAALAESAKVAGVAPVALKCAVVSGDTLQTGMRKSIEDFFQCRCYDQYGQVEGVSLAMECREGRLHLAPEVGVVEILRANNEPCAPGEVGEMVATGLINDGMPFIRYRTGDLAALAADQRCACGLTHPIIEALEGRVDDYLVTADGRWIGRLSTAMKRSPSIHSVQIVQDRPGHAFLLIRPGEGYRSVDAPPVRDDIVERIGGFDFDIVEVDEIPKMPTGKMRLVLRLSDRPELRGLYGELLAKARTPVAEARS